MQPPIITPIDNVLSPPHHIQQWGKLQYQSLVQCTSDRPVITENDNGPKSKQISTAQNPMERRRYSHSIIIPQSLKKTHFNIKTPWSNRLSWLTSLIFAASVCRHPTMMPRSVCPFSIESNFLKPRDRYFIWSFLRTPFS